MSLRHRLPNLIAVDFFRQGDVLGVARTLNRLERLIATRTPNPLDR